MSAAAAAAATSSSSSHFPVDSHCHIRCLCEASNTGAPTGKQLQDMATAVSPQPLICATSPTTDWNSLALLARSLSPPAATTAQSSNIRVGFGVHPWWVKELNVEDNQEQQSPSWLHQLSCHLEDFPHAIVGEIGLDKLNNNNNNNNSGDHKSDQNHDFSRQVSVFEQQMDLAARFSRPVSVHLVRCSGPALQLFSQRPIERYPPTVILHGYSGSLDFAQSLLKLNRGRGQRFFFGFGAATTGKLKHLPALLSALPVDRVLIESDEFVNENREAALEKLHAMAGALTASGRWTIEKLKENQELALKVG